MLTAYREFQGVTQELVLELRKTHQLKVIQDMDTYAKRSVVRNLNFPSKFSRDELFFICDQYFGVQFYELASGQKKSSDRLSRTLFPKFLSKLADWANTQPDMEDQQARGAVPKPVSGSSFMDKMFKSFDLNDDGLVDFPDVVKGLSLWIHSTQSDLMLLFFKIHDENGDNLLTKEETIQLSESLLFIHRRQESDKYLTVVSNFMTYTFAMFDREPEKLMTLQTFTELITGDECLDAFFTTELAASFVLKDTKSSVQQTVYVRPKLDFGEGLFKNMKWSGRLGLANKGGKGPSGGANTDVVSGSEAEAVVDQTEESEVSNAAKGSPDSLMDQGM